MEWAGLKYKHRRSKKLTGHLSVYQLTLINRLRNIMMSARYSLLVILIVVTLLTINSLWLSRFSEQPCLSCDTVSPQSIDNPSH